MKQEIRVGSRDSALALWQTNWVLARLKEQHPGLQFKVVEIKTQGDKMLDVALSKIGDKGLFTKELELAMLRGEIDLAVHSLKDLPTTLPDGLTTGAICQREYPGDALVSRTGKNLAALPRGASIGTSSLRRGAQLLRYRPDFKLVALRGNLNTRMKKLVSQQLDAVVLAAAGLTRMGWGDQITQLIPYEICLPAVGQGAIAVEIRDGDREMTEIVGKVNHPATVAAVTAERALLRRLEGGCQVPIGTLGQVSGEQVSLQAVIASLDGTKAVRDTIDGPTGEAESLGICLAERLLDMGGKEILDQVRQGNDK